MAKFNFGGVEETVITREEFPLSKALETLKGETLAVLGYGVQGPGQGLDLRDNGFNVIVGQRPGKTYDKAVADGWVPGETLFSIEEACQRGTIIMCLLSDAAVISQWPVIKTSHSGQSPLLQPWIRHQLERPHRCGATLRCRRDNGGSERFRHNAPRPFQGREGH